MATILVVDDDAAVRRAVRKTLETRGHTIIEAADGVEGVQRFEAESPDIVITDLYMPGGDGMEAVIRIVSAYPEARVVVMSGGGWEQVQPLLDKVRSLGAAATLTKPFGVVELIKTVNDLLDSPDA